MDTRQTRSPDLVGLTEIAERAGVRRDTVDEWRRRDIGFPVPSAELAAGPIWRWSRVQGWLERTGRAQN